MEEIRVSEYGRGKDGVYFSRELDENGQQVRYPAAVLGYTFAEIDGKTWAVLSPEVRRDEKIVLAEAVLGRQGRDHPAIVKPALQFQGMYVHALKAKGWRFPNLPPDHKDQEIVWEVRRAEIGEVLSVTTGERRLSDLEAMRKDQFRTVNSEQIIVPLKLPYVNLCVDMSNPLVGAKYVDIERVPLKGGVVQDETYRRIRPKPWFQPKKQAPQVPDDRKGKR